MLNQLQKSTFQLQNCLRNLYFYKYLTTEVIPDGIYGHSTRKAIEEFQKLNGFPVTGVTNYKTWSNAFKKHKEIEKQLKK
jgi:peptidoglycan hydrolase-like protein with peptidoglycan-binding domain